ncbi:MAG: MFS transporter [Acidobacteriaceae bacterium]
MELLLEDKEGSSVRAAFWRNPTQWFREKNLGRGFWIFFVAAFFFDAGFSVYFFLFNLYLLDFHFNEKAIGLVNGALTLGALVGTLPVGALGRRMGLRPVLLFCFVAAPLTGVARAFWMWEPAQIGLAFLAGMVMCTWTVSFLPAVANLTTEKNRTSAIGLTFSVGVGTSALGGAVCGYLPQWLRMARFSMQSAEVKRLILLASSALAAAGMIAVLRLHLPARTENGGTTGSVWRGATWLRGFKLNAFLRRFLPCMALWSAVLAAFIPFANVYLSRDLHLPLVRIGLIFSLAQVVQLTAGLFLPLLVRVLGLINSIVATQLATALSLALLAAAHHEGLAIVLYLSFSAAQWISSPGLYNLLMNETPEAERSPASAMTMFSNALLSSIATAAAGILLTRFGYAPVLLGIAGFALAIAALCRVLLAPHREGGAVSQIATGTVTD